MFRNMLSMSLGRTFLSFWVAIQLFISSEYGIPRSLISKGANVNGEKLSLWWYLQDKRSRTFVNVLIRFILSALFLVHKNESIFFAISKRIIYLSTVSSLIITNQYTIRYKQSYTSVRVFFSNNSLKTCLKIRITSASFWSLSNASTIYILSGIRCFCAIYPHT